MSDDAQRAEAKSEPEVKVKGVKKPMKNNSTGANIGPQQMK